MKKLLGWAAGLVFAAIVIGTGLFLWKKSQVKPVVYQVVSPARADIVRKTVATGAVVPRKEVLVKPLIGGIIDELYVEAGQAIKEGDLIARIRVIPNMVSLSSAEARVNKSKIAFADADREYKRSQALAADGTIAAAELQKAEIVFLQAQEEQKAAQDNLDIVRKGTSQRLSSASTTIVRSTLGGMVLEVPLEVGNSVVESNNFNDGTTIAAIADMDDLIFEGKVDESEVGKIKVGMPLELTIGALPDKTIHATLEHIAPKGVTENGAIQFEIRAALQEDSELFIRANMSASADIVLEKKEDVLSIDEALLQFEGDEPFVEVETANQVFEKRAIETGISDGMRIEVVSGLTETDKIKNPNPDAPIAVAGEGGPGAAGAGQGGRRRQQGALGTGSRPRRAS
jgi:HlyD family secretion protein